MTCQVIFGQKVIAIYKGSLWTDRVGMKEEL